MSELPEHVRRNRAFWDGMADWWVDSGRRNWQQSEPTWCIWDIPESEVHLLPDDLAGKDVIELGCGTGYVSAWLARRGARPVGIDNSPRQLETAMTFQHEFGIDFPLILGNAEDVPLPDASFDFHLGYGDWIRLLRANEFEVEDMIELRPAPDATTRFPYVKIDWARRWPSEEAWKARKAG